MDTDEKAHRQALLQQADLGIIRRDEISTVDEKKSHYAGQLKTSNVSSFRDPGQRGVKTEHRTLLDGWSSKSHQLLIYLITTSSYMLNGPSQGLKETEKQDEDDLDSMMMGQSHRARLQSGFQNNSGFDTISALTSAPKGGRGSFPAVRGGHASRGERVGGGGMSAHRIGRANFPASKKSFFDPAIEKNNTHMPYSRAGRSSFSTRGVGRGGYPTARTGCGSIPSPRSRHSVSPRMTPIHHNKYRVKQGYGQGDITGGYNSPQPQTSGSASNPQLYQEKDLLVFDSPPRKNSTKTVNRVPIPDLMDIDEGEKLSKLFSPQNTTPTKKKNIANVPKVSDLGTLKYTVVEKSAKVKENITNSSSTLGLQTFRYATAEKFIPVSKENITDAPKTLVPASKYAMADEFFPANTENIGKSPTILGLQDSKYAMAKESGAQASILPPPVNLKISKCEGNSRKEDQSASDYWLQALPRAVKNLGEVQSQPSPPSSKAFDLSKSRFAH
ncbi:hypothetical protein BGW36DRAFT_359029 [Talaromyces proteolyticus]|uniref:Uncharacterized protein n=1 Tax=Talaromyces proteolyticus TaxID=1131652 RepID=A0AAD4KR82_9EURO|nr:uncharacterized protein BGW36DRAFT_359029 [Talaromyces proteolyticus]KAH8697228.1 hypothetical protein BGW36DRAFT_359029 [Talaromyces proteolyticus]